MTKVASILFPLYNSGPTAIKPNKGTQYGLKTNENSIQIMQFKFSQINLILPMLSVGR